MAISIDRGEFKGLACARLSNGVISLAVTTGRGPRVVSWGWAGGANMLAELPGFVVRGFSFLGGHRLWAAPESFSRTYRPDDEPPVVHPTTSGATITAPPDADGLVKEMALDLAVDGPQVTVTHTLRNAGREALEVAPWALSMLRLGGVMILPQPHGPVDADGLLPNRRVVLWPYSDIADPRLRLGNRFALVDARPVETPNKVGYLNRAGWLAYWLDGTLFSTRFDPQPDRAFPDYGCNAECYFDHRFIEMETLGPLVHLAAGDKVQHVEHWQLYPDLPRPASEAEAEAIARSAGLLSS